MPGKIYYINRVEIWEGFSEQNFYWIYFFDESKKKRLPF
ncbi:hypothetical protein SAMN05216324_13129 [Chryseobacterium limigenitum]|uniref:GH10 domain-containing protein n=1 Tax=Chryseobacterium limigenitum TaxID=1612149 RepID=A0A1K2IXG6_9FLAO|nr:hypothetical protein SAMN05216324_13129 [Chryseobacterium limigenitum]